MTAADQAERPAYAVSLDDWAAVSAAVLRGLAQTIESDMSLAALLGADGAATDLRNIATDLPRALAVARTGQQAAAGVVHGWVILELMGHRRLAGHVTEVQVAGDGFLRLDIPGPAADGPPAATQFYRPGVVYAITPTTEDVARATPVARWELQSKPTQDRPADQAWEPVNFRAEGRRMSTAGSMLLITGTGHTYTPHQGRTDRLQPKMPGDHVWIAAAAFRLTDESARASGAGGGQIHLDVENLASIDVGCYVCEQPWSQRLAHRRCTGEPRA